MRGVHALDTVRQDLRYALRTFRRSPSFTVTVVSMIACGLALNVAVFTLFSHYVLRPFPVRAPASLYEFGWADRSGSAHRFSWPDYSRLERQPEVFSDVAAFRTVLVRVNGRPLQGGLVTGNYFTMLGVGAELGRTLGPADTSAPGQEAVMVLSHATWRSRFGGAADIVGRRLALGGIRLEVVGVAAPGFNGVGETPLDFWVPVTIANQLETGPDLFGPEQPRSLRILGRLQAHLSTGQAEARLATWVEHLTAQRPEADRPVRAILHSRATALPLTPQVIVAFSPVVIVFGLVLGLACANVANMMLARGLRRQRELGIRVALGATPGRLVRQLLTESVLLAFVAGCLAVPISQIVIRGSVKRHDGHPSCGHGRSRPRSGAAGRYAGPDVHDDRSTGGDRRVRTRAGSPDHTRRRHFSHERRVLECWTTRPAEKCARRHASRDLRPLVDWLGCSHSRGDSHRRIRCWVYDGRRDCRQGRRHA